MEEFRRRAALGPLLRDKLFPRRFLIAVWRRLIASPEAQEKALYQPGVVLSKGWHETSMSALGQKRTCAVQQPMSALPPTATAKADICQPTITKASRYNHQALSALPPKADACSAASDVR
jgi:hypothetical protein